MENSPRIPDAIDANRLAAMREVARMKDFANKIGSPFIGGFIDDNGQMFVMTNIEDSEDRQVRRFMQGFNGEQG